MSRPAVLLALAAVLFGYGRLHARSQSSSGIDYFQFWGAGRAARLWPELNPYAELDRGEIPARLATVTMEGRAFADASQRRPVLHTNGSPLLYALAGLGASERYERDFAVFQAASNLAFAAGVLLLTGLARWSWPVRLAGLAFVLTWNDPLYSDAAVGNVSRLQLAGLALVLVLVARSRPMAAAMVAGLLAAFKPTLAFVAPILVVSAAAGRPRPDSLRSAARAAGAAAAAVGLAIGFAAVRGFAPGRWWGWIRDLVATPAASVPFENGNLALLPASLGAAPRLVPWIAFAGLAVIAARAPGDPSRALWPPALAAVLPLLTGPLAWVHYFLLALPAVQLGLSEATSTAGRLASALAAVLYCVWPLHALVGGPDTLRVLLFLQGATLIVLAVGVAEMLRPPRAAEGGPAPCGTL